MNSRPARATYDVSDVGMGHDRGPLVAVTSPCGPLIACTGLAVPRPAVRSLLAEDRSAGGDRTGAGIPLGLGESAADWLTVDTRGQERTPNVLRNGRSLSR
jgi:hypothetical protein